MEPKLRLGCIAVLISVAVVACGGGGGNGNNPPPSSLASTSSNPSTPSNPSAPSNSSSPTTYTISGLLSGLDASNNVVLQDNGADNLTVTANGTFSFATPIALNAPYAVTVTTNPYWQSCTVNNSSGSSTHDNVTNVIINCGPANAVVSTLAGSGVFGFQDSPALSASFAYPMGVAVDTSGNVYVADNNNNVIRKISTPAGVPLVTTLAGQASPHNSGAGFADGASAVAMFSSPWAVAVDTSGNVYVADTNNNRIRKITPAGVVTTLAGSGASGSADGIGSAASFTIPQGVAVDTNGNVYVSDTGSNRIRKITPAGVVTTLAGSGTPGNIDGTGAGASFANPDGLAVDTSGNVYVADGYNNKIRKITPAGVVTTLAGSGASGSADGTGTAASFSYPEGVAVDTKGNVYVADGEKIRKITPAGMVTTLAGSSTSGNVDGTGTAASFNGPKGVTVDANGNLYVADMVNNKIRKITPTP